MRHILSRPFVIVLLLFLTTGVLPGQLSAQNSPYQLDWKKDAPAVVAGMGLSLSSYMLEQGVDVRTEDEIAGLSSSRLISLDRGATRNYDLRVRDASDWLLQGSALLPFTLMADRDIRNDAGKIAILFSESALLTYGFTNLTKVLVLRDRPYVHNPEVSLADKLTPDARLSFFSGHTSMAANFSFFTAKVWTDYHPDSDLKLLVWTAAATLPAVTGYLRYEAGKHYITDVVTGYAVGALLGYFVPHLHKIEKNEKRKLRISAATIMDVPVFSVKYRF